MEVVEAERRLDYARLDRARSLFDPPHAVTFRLRRLATATKNRGPESAAETCVEHVEAITVRLSDMGALAERLAWQKALNASGSLRNDSYWSYVGLDVEQFLAKLRAIMDHVARILRAIGSSKGRDLPLRFAPMYERRKDILDPKIQVFVSGFDWFCDARDLRDSITHEGHSAEGSPGSGLPFLVLTRDNDHLEVPKEAMLVEQRLADFEVFGGALFAQTLLALDELADLVVPRLSVTLDPEHEKMGIAGGAVLEEWFGRALASASAGFPIPSDLARQLSAPESDRSD